MCEQDVHLVKSCNVCVDIKFRNPFCGVPSYVKIILLNYFIAHCRTFSSTASFLFNFIKWGFIEKAPSLSNFIQFLRSFTVGVFCLLKPINITVGFGYNILLQALGHTKVHVFNAGEFVTGNLKVMFKSQICCNLLSRMSWIDNLA